METNIINLDKLRGESRKIIFLGEEFEMGYIPCCKSIPLLEMYKDQIERQKDGNENAESIFEDNLEMVAFFCSDIITRDRIEKEATREQVVSFYVEIIRSIFDEYLSKAPDSDGGDNTDPAKKNRTGAAS